MRSGGERVVGVVNGSVCGWGVEGGSVSVRWCAAAALPLRRAGGVRRLCAELLRDAHCRLLRADPQVALPPRALLQHVWMVPTVRAEVSSRRTARECGVTE